MCSFCKAWTIFEMRLGSFEQLQRTAATRSAVINPSILFIPQVCSIPPVTNIVLTKTSLPCGGMRKYDLWLSWTWSCLTVQVAESWDTLEHFPQHITSFQYCYQFGFLSAYDDFFTYLSLRTILITLCSFPTCSLIVARRPLLGLTPDYLESLPCAVWWLHWDHPILSLRNE